MPDHIELLSLTDIGCNDDIPETSDSIEGNALLKAKFVKDHYGLDCFADDTGLEVTALNHQPGVYSARYAGPEKDADANMNKLLTELENQSDRSARFKTAISLILEGQENLFLGVCEGRIINQKRGDKGFGYDPIFQPLNYKETFAQMTMIQKSEIGHRGKAMRKLIAHLSKTDN